MNGKDHYRTMVKTTRNTSIRRLFPHITHVLVARITLRVVSSSAAARDELDGTLTLEHCCFLDKDPQYDCNRQTDISIYVPRQRLGTVSCKVMWDDSYGTYPSV
jgi:hypothetical protein